jgi:hypothetical protein
MAVALKSWKLKTLILKTETTYGTDSVPTAGANGVLAMNMSISIDADKLERPIDHPYLGANPFVLVGKRITVEFDFEPLGNSAVGSAAPCGPILTACAHSETLVAVTSATYALASTSLKSVSIYFQMENQKVVVLGARGTIDYDWTVKQFPKAHAKLTGMFAIPVFNAIPSPTVSAWQTPVAVEMETMLVTIGGTAVNTMSFMLSQGNDVNIHEGSESREAAILARAATGTLKVYDPGIDVLDLWTPAKNYTPTAIVCTVDGGAGKKAVMTVPNAQLQLPKWTEMDGTIGLEIPFTAVPSSAGNDEYNLAFT